MYSSLRASGGSVLVALLFAACGEGGSGATEPPHENNDTLISPIRARDTLAISFGTSFGECGGYCITEFEVSERSVQRTRRSWEEGSTAFPPVRTGLEFRPGTLDSLWAQVDVETFMALPERIGCPDCADGGAEWIELSYPSGRKSVTIELGADIPEIAGLLKALFVIQSDPRWPAMRD